MILAASWMLSSFSENRDSRQDLRGEREGEAEPQTVPDPREGRQHPGGGQDHAGAPGRDLRVHGEEGEGRADPRADEALSRHQGLYQNSDHLKENLNKIL